MYSSTKKLKNKALWGIILGGVLMLVAPYFLTRETWLPGFLHSGQIGDTIGGITAPIVNFLGAILVYFALLAQVKANEIIQGQIEEQKQHSNYQRELEIIDSHINYIIRQIENLTRKEDLRSYGTFEQAHREDKNYLILKGSDAVKLILTDLIRFFPDVYLHKSESEIYMSVEKSDELMGILHMIWQTLQKIKSTNFTANDKQLHLLPLRNEFDYKIFYPLVNELIEYANDVRRPKCSKCDKIHGQIPTDFYTQIEKIDELITELSDDPVARIKLP